jgi:hypothetical protein
MPAAVGRIVGPLPLLAWGFCLAGAVAVEYSLVEHRRCSGRVAGPCQSSRAWSADPHVLNLKPPMRVRQLYEAEPVDSTAGEPECAVIHQIHRQVTVAPIDCLYRLAAWPAKSTDYLGQECSAGRYVGRHTARRHDRRAGALKLSQVAAATMARCPSSVGGIRRTCFCARSRPPVTPQRTIACPRPRFFRHRRDRNWPRRSMVAIAAISQLEHQPVGDCIQPDPFGSGTQARERTKLRESRCRRIKKVNVNSPEPRSPHGMGDL